ncbi:uncharacterized protein G2W53_026949 [Senna tora]|uniref:Uncharacterized protein n=1 Tax=Senna tora TaxID=362788 RepID=A0A834WLU4_9FABA|nr:uncharacterized protein G2W53_026949 [Senna tora]
MAIHGVVHRGFGRAQVRLP